MVKLTFLLVISLSTCLWGTGSSITCKTETGDTSWFLLIKPPRGVNTLYADKAKPYLYRHSLDIDQRSNPVELTMRPLYFPELSEQPLNYFMYNDEIPGFHINFDHGHTKGVVMFDNTSMVMIVHSTPHFPYKESDGYGYPRTGKRNGQHFFCMTLPLTALSNILKSIRMMWPLVYNHKVDSRLYEKYPDLKAILEDVPFSEKDTPEASQLLSVNLVDETEISIYTKSARFGADIFDGFIATSYDPPISLYTETWQLGVPWHKLHSNCSGNYFVKNIKSLHFTDLQVNYAYPHDHSKWAISASEPNLVCFGGVNRMSSQFRRGGGMFCFSDKILWEFLNPLLALSKSVNHQGVQSVGFPIFHPYSYVCPIFPIFFSKFIFLKYISNYLYSSS